MGIFASKPPPPKPNPYARRDAPEHSEPPLPPLSPARHLKAVLLRRHGGAKPIGATVHDKSFGLSKKFASRYEIGEEVGQGHFGYTCSAIAKKGELKGHKVAVKIIPKSKMTAAIAVEVVQREIKILRALKGHPNLVQFYDAYEDVDNVYIVMELCEGQEFLDTRLRRNGKFSEDSAKAVIVQILNLVAFCHLHGIVHLDIKPENLLFTSKDENSELKAINFGSSDFIRPDQKLNEIVGSAYFVAPEVLQRSYGTEADIWSVGVIVYTLLCGTRPFCAQTESGISQAIKKDNLDFDANPWPSMSSECKDFVRRLLCVDPSRRLTAAQALCHPWLRNHSRVKLSLDMHIFRLMKAYMRSSTLRKAALRALSKTLTVDELFYLKEQFDLMCPDANGGITYETIKMALKRNATNAMKESRIQDFLDPLNALQYRRMYFEEFCAAAISVPQLEVLDKWEAAAISVPQLEVLDKWEERTSSAYEIFEKDGNRAIIIEELSSELVIGPSVPVYTVLQEWIRHTDGKLNLRGFVRLLIGHSTPTFSKRCSDS